MRYEAAPFIIPHPSYLILHPSYLTIMPIVINELHIKARVSEQADAAQGQGSSNAATANAQNNGNDKTEELKKSVDAIMDILKRKNER